MSSWVEDWEWLVEFFLRNLLLFHSVKSCLSINPSPGNCVRLMTNWFSLFPLNQWFIIYFGLAKTHSPILMASTNHLTNLSKNEGKEPSKSKQDSWITQALMCVDKITDAALCPPSRLQTNDLKIEVHPVSPLPCPTKCVCHEKELNFLLWLNYQLLELNIFMMVYLLPKYVLFPWHWGECFIKEYKEFALQFKKKKAVSHLALEGLCTVSHHGLGVAGVKSQNLADIGGEALGLCLLLFGKESTCQCRRPGLTPASGRSPGGGNGNPLQYFCLENSMDRGAWWATVHGVAKSQTWLSTQKHKCLQKMKILEATSENTSGIKE